MSTARTSLAGSLLRLLPRLALGLGLVGFLAWRYRGELAGLGERGVRPLFLIAAVALLLGNMLVTFYRWAVMARAQGLRISFSEAVRLGFIGYISSLVLPSSVSGDVVRSVLVARSQERRTAAVASVWVDRLVGLMGLAWLAALAALAAVSLGVAALTGLAWWVMGMGTLVTVGFALLLALPRAARVVARVLAPLPRVGGLVAELLVAVRAYRDRLRVVLVACGLGVAGHSLFLASTWMGGMAVWDEPPRLLVHLVVTPIALLTSVLPLTPGGLGIAELAVSGLFEVAGEDPGAALLMMLVSRVGQIAILTVAALALAVDLRALPAGAVDRETARLEGRDAAARPGADPPSTS